MTPFHARTVTAEPAGGPGTAPAEANGRLWNDRRPRGRELPAHARRGRASQLNDTWLTHAAGGRWHPASSPPQGSALASARTPVPSPYPVRPVSVPSRLRQCPVRTHIAPAHSLESRRTCTKAAGRRPSRPANDRQSSATAVGDEPLTTGVRGANGDRLGVRRFKRAVGLTLWPGHARPAPGAATWTQRCGTGRQAPGRPDGGVCGL